MRLKTPGDSLDEIDGNRSKTSEDKRKDRNI